MGTDDFVGLEGKLSHQRLCCRELADRSVRKGALVLALTGWLATDPLSLLESRMRMKPTLTERTPPSLGHTFLFQKTS